VVGEALLNSLGYGLMAQGQVEAGLAAFRFNVAEHPDSWNVHDSLGEAYMRTGQKEKAIASYRRSLELNPENENGRDKLEQLEAESADEE
jgi:Flp pilus assembly protein TadD